ncbi:hypothetical protein B0H21DRAFT_550491 [Amylocystis lapponica]|nr:hypothetical protein B0H21DRAFT_550491 [Amylocystis lapponica]
MFANPYMPGCAIDEEDMLACIVLFNYITYIVDPSGASNYTAQVSIKDLLAESVPVKVNMTWADQTFGTRFSVLVPGLALVFLSSGAMGTTTQTFPTTTAENPMASAAVNASVLATSNGERDKDRGSRSSVRKGSAGAAAGSSWCSAATCRVACRAGVMRRVLM